jgi:hypothetical protein
MINDTRKLKTKEFTVIRALRLFIQEKWLDSKSSQMIYRKCDDSKLQMKSEMIRREEYKLSQRP